MKIRVTGAGKSTYWYAKMVGEVFETDGKLDSDGDYRVDGGFINCEDCEIVEEGENMTKNVTVLTDANGVQREYIEVKRKANVGERVKVVLSDGGMRPCVGDLLTITCVHDGDSLLVNGDVPASCMLPKNYIVLEPTSTVIIDGVRYTEEKRKARVGERILITEKETHNMRDMTIGKLYEVTDIYYGEVNVIDDAGDEAEVSAYSYVVLTKVPDSAPQTIAQEPATMPTIINVNLMVTVQPGADVAQTVADAVRAEMRRVTTDDTIALRKPTEKSPQELRDEIVERAKADVAELSAKSTFIYREDEWFNPHADEVTYVINREKRTVVALIQRKYSGKVWARGLAKCAPGDVFSEEIGKVIALRRALGLEVLSEFLGRNVIG